MTKKEAALLNYLEFNLISTSIRKLIMYTRM